jgi:hypothetical protein
MLQDKHGQTLFHLPQGKRFVGAPLENQRRLSSKLKKPLQSFDARQAKSVPGWEKLTGPGQSWSTSK